VYKRCQLASSMWELLAAHATSLLFVVLLMSLSMLGCSGVKG